MNWQNYIHSDEKILKGKPVIKGTRLSVDFLLGLYKAGWDEKQILTNYPQLTKKSLRSLFEFVQDCMQHELIYLSKP